MRKPPKHRWSSSTSRAVAAQAGQRGPGQSGQNGREQGAPVDISIFDVGGQGRGRGGEKVEQIDPLGQGLGDAGEGGHIDQQQRAAADTEAGEYAGGRPGDERNEPAHQNKRALTPP